MDEVFDIGGMDALDEAEMTVTMNGKLTTWTWRFAGPGHPATVAWNNKAARERLHRDAQKEQAVVNGKKWKAEEESVDEVRRKNVDWIVARLLGWSPVRINGEDLPFNAENARKLLLDYRKNVLQQAIDFLSADDSFAPRSATNS